ncbi:MAG TPA: transposase [Verrucomicrobiae bacterium]|nr:transposase [Verrucomicrobiae bacterium]
MSYVSSYYHCVFSTKERQPQITPNLREKLWPYMGGIARLNKMTAIEIGGVSDHVHILLSLPSTLSIARALQLIKGGSSKWVHDTFPETPFLGWQVKYAPSARACRFWIRLSPTSAPRRSTIER